MRIQNPIILFDGVCNLCNGTVDFILRRDKKKQFRYVALQSETGSFLSEKFKIPIDTDSVILINKNTVFLASDAVIEIGTLLKFPWNSIALLKIIPKTLRDKIYLEELLEKNKAPWKTWK
mgnify:CR=1 FL=1